MTKMSAQGVLVTNQALHSSILNLRNKVNQEVSVLGVPLILKVNNS